MKRSHTTYIVRITMYNEEGLPETFVEKVRACSTTEAYWTLHNRITKRNWRFSGSMAPGAWHASRKKNTRKALSMQKQKLKASLPKPDVGVD